MSRILAQRRQTDLSQGSWVADWSSLLFAVWAAGVVIVLVRGAFGELLFRRVLKQAVPLHDPRVLGLLGECAERIGVRCPRIATVAEHLDSPALHGLGPVRLLLPERLVCQLDDDAMRHVLMHELAHHKHRDTWLPLLLLPLSALWWFHPLVQLALKRMRLDQEAARDFEALNAAEKPEPVAYARTLIALLESGRPSTPSTHAAFLFSGNDIKRRIEMIANFRRTNPNQYVLGLVVFVALAWITLLSAKQDPHVPQPERVRAVQQADLETIAFERPDPDPAWLGAMQAKLDQSMDARLDGVEYMDALAWFEDKTSIEVVLSPELMQYESVEIRLDVEGTTAREILDLILELTGFAAWTPHRGVILVGAKVDLQIDSSLRFYRIQPLMDQVGEDDREDWIDQILYLVMENAGPGSWDREGVSIEAWGNLLMVRQSETVHRQVHALLNRFLNRGREPKHVAPPWLPKLEGALDTRIDMLFEDLEIDSVADYLSETTGVPFLVDPCLAESLFDAGTQFNLDLKGVAVRTGLDWIADLADVNFALRGGAIVFVQEETTRLEFYDIRGLTKDFGGDVSELIDVLDNLIRSNVDPASWDENPRCSMQAGNGALYIVQSPAAHEEIQRLLDSLMRALQ